MARGLNSRPNISRIPQIPEPCVDVDLTTPGLTVDTNGLFPLYWNRGIPNYKTYIDGNGFLQTNANTTPNAFPLEYDAAGTNGNMLPNVIWSGLALSPATFPSGWQGTGLYFSCITPLVAQNVNGILTQPLNLSKNTADTTQGFQVTTYYLGIGTYVFSAFIRYNGGGSTNNFSIYLGTGVPATTIVAPAATISAQPVGQWIRQSTIITVTTPTTTVAFCSLGAQTGDAGVGYGFDIALPQIVPGNILTPFVSTFPVLGRSTDVPRTNVISNNSDTTSFSAASPAANSNLGALNTAGGWSIGQWNSGTNPVNGITISTVGTGGIESGIPFVDIRFSGTATSNGNTGVFFCSTSGISTVQYDIWAGSGYFKLVAGTNPPYSTTAAVPGPGFRLTISESTSGTFNRDAIGNAFVIPTSTPLSANRNYTASTPNLTTQLTTAGVNYVVLALMLYYDSGAVIDTTVRIGGIQLEKCNSSVLASQTGRGSSSALILTNAGARARVGSGMGNGILRSRYAGKEHTFFQQWSSFNSLNQGFNFFAGVSAVGLSVSDAVNSGGFNRNGQGPNIVVQESQSGTNPILVACDVSNSITSVVYGTTNKIAASMMDYNMNLSLNGNNAATGYATLRTNKVTNTPGYINTQLYLSTSDEWIQKFKIWNRKLSTDQMNIITGGSDPLSWQIQNAAVDDFFGANPAGYGTCLEYGIPVPISNHLSCARASSETITWADGHLSYVGNNQLALSDLGLAIWEGRTNLVYSPLLTGPFWYFNGGATYNNGGFQAPDLSNSAVLWSRNVTTNSYTGIFSVTKAASAIQYTMSLYVKQNVGKYVTLRVQGANPSRADVNFDLSTGTKSTAEYITTGGVSGNFTNASAAIIPSFNGWYRISLTVTSDTATNINGMFSFNSNNTALDLSDTALSSGYFWGPQFEASDTQYPSPYIIPNSSGNASRASESITAIGVLSKASLVTPGTIFFQTNGSSQSSYSARVLGYNGNWGMALSGTGVQIMSGGTSILQAPLSSGTNVTRTRGCAIYNGTYSNLQCGNYAGQGSATGTTADSRATATGTICVGDVSPGNGTTTLNCYLERLTVIPYRQGLLLSTN